LNSKLQKKAVGNAEHPLSEIIVKSILEKKGKEVILLDLEGLSDAVCDRFIICEGGSTTQVKAIADFIAFNTKKELGEMPLHSEGFGNQEWILIDYFDVVVHIFLKEKREFYKLEELWSDAKFVRYEEDGSQSEF